MAPGESASLVGVHPDENGDCSSIKHPRPHQLHLTSVIPTHPLLCVLVVIHTILVKSLMIKNNQENHPLERTMRMPEETGKLIEDHLE